MAVGGRRVKVTVGKRESLTQIAFTTLSRSEKIRYRAREDDIFVDSTILMVGGEPVLN